MTLKRPHLVWLGFAACVAVGLGVLAWFSREMLRLEHETDEARRQAVVEENARLALWRLDSAMAAIHGSEAARPWSSYLPFAPAAAAFSPDLRALPEGTVMLPSPLLGYTPPFVRLHFQIEADGTITSPQLPDDPDLEAALAASDPAQLARIRASLADLHAHVSYDEIAADLSRQSQAGQTRAAMLDERLPAARRALAAVTVAIDRPPPIAAAPRSAPSPVRSQPEEAKAQVRDEFVFAAPMPEAEAASKDVTEAVAEEQAAPPQPAVATQQNEFPEGITEGLTPQTKSANEQLQREELYLAQNTIYNAENRRLNLGNFSSAPKKTAEESEPVVRSTYAKSRARRPASSSSSSLLSSFSRSDADAMPSAAEVEEAPPTTDSKDKADNEIALAFDVPTGLAASSQNMPGGASGSRSDTASSPEASAVRSQMAGTTTFAAEAAITSTPPTAGKGEWTVATDGKLSSGFAETPRLQETTTVADDAAPREVAAAAAPMVAEPLPISLLDEPMQAIWVGDELMLARRVYFEDHTVVQGAWLDWPALQSWLLARVHDLFPDARLEPCADNGGAATTSAPEAARRLAFLPVRLEPGTTSFGHDNGWSPLRTSLAAAWLSAIVGSAALALLLAGTLALSERRGAFVSAVTHELRTPLTTFRMYTEMLSSGMVPDETRRRGYIDTLRKEAERLSHLVENVLSYARLERGRASSRIEDTTPADLLARMEDRLRQRAEQGSLDLRIEVPDAVADRPLRTDTSAVEQILFNLVDNAAKYARPADIAAARNRNGSPAPTNDTAGESASSAPLVISVAADGPRGLVIRVTDHGPGLPPAARKRLFQPFSKSAHEAAHSQPGVGLGLALCRRLARDELHGALLLESTGPDGTTFRLELPAG